MRRPKRANRKKIERYKTRCDNHPDRPSKYAFIEASTGERRGLCAECFEVERKAAMRRLRIQRIRARRKK